jgi:hypothetical protein
MAVFGQLSPGITINRLQTEFSALFTALEALEDSYQWASAYALSDLEGPPFNYPSGDAQAILNALADAHDLYETARGTAGFPLATLPYNFTASMRVISGVR